MKKALIGIGFSVAALTLALSNAQDQTTLKILGFKVGAELAALPALNERFTKETGIKVEYEAISDAGGFAEVIRTRFAGGDVPDVFMNHGRDEAKTFAPAGYMADLSAEPWVKTLTASAASVAKIGGKTYLLPAEFVSLGLYYNTALLEKAGIKSLPQTYSQFLSALNTSKTKGINPFLVPGKDGWAFVTSLIMATELWRTNPDLTEDMLAGKVKFDSTGWRTVFTNLANLGKRGLIDTTLNLGIDGSQAMNEFKAGRLAFLVHGSWEVTGLKKNFPNLKFGFMGFPSGPANTKPVGIVLPGVAWAVSAKSKNAVAARKYVAFWAQEKNLNDWLVSANAFSPLKGGVVPLPSEMKPFSDAAADDRAINFPLADWPAGFQDAYAKATIEAMQGKDIRTILRGLDQSFSKK